LQPTSDTERHEILDVLRGFALYGVLLANLVWLTTDMVLTDARLHQLPTATVDPIAKGLVVFFIDGKFYTLFSFLFGLGFSLQMQRAGTRGAGIVACIRRLSVLIVIAVIHIALIWYGDILLMYASLGFALLLFRRARPTLKLVMLALVLALSARTAFTAYHAVTRSQSVSSTVSEAEQDARTKEARLAAFLSGYPQVVRENVAIYWNTLIVSGVLWFALPTIFSRILIGLYVGQKRLVERVAEYVPLMRRALPWLVVAAVIGNLVGLLHWWLVHERGMKLSDSWWTVATIPLAEAGVLALSAVYACGICALFYGGGAGRGAWLGWPRSGGWHSRLPHTACCTAAVHRRGIWLAWQSRTGDLRGTQHRNLLAQVVVSGWWLQRYRFGPAEWVWRTPTYGRAQPM
jgi:uncharacterized protein